tara:strand:+ start:124 stop:351 length:228 start_codon:yes stop_codon:yes gene_type:complete
MNELNGEIVRSIGRKKYITFLYWKLKIKNILTSNNKVNIEVIEINPNSDFAKILKKACAGNFDKEYQELVSKAKL